MSRKRKKELNSKELQHIRISREYRIAIVKHLRKQPRCVICGTIKGREVHHKYSMKYYPELATDPDNLVTLCGHKANGCHTMLHTKYKKSYRQKTTADDFNDFMEIINHGKKYKK